MNLDRFTAQFNSAKQYQIRYYSTLINKELVITRSTLQEVIVHVNHLHMINIIKQVEGTPFQLLERIHGAWVVISTSTPKLFLELVK